MKLLSIFIFFTLILLSCENTTDSLLGSSDTTYITKHDTLSKIDTMKIIDTLSINDTLKVSDTLYISDTATVTDTLHTIDTLRVNDTLSIIDTLNLIDTLQTMIKGNVTIKGESDYSLIDITLLSYSLVDDKMTVLAITKTSQNGDFILKNIPEGEYFMQIGKDGYSTITESVTVTFQTPLILSTPYEIALMPYRDNFLIGGDTVYCFDGEFENVLKMPSKIDNIYSCSEFLTVGPDSTIYFFGNGSYSNTHGYDTLYAVDDISGTNLRKVAIPDGGMVKGIYVSANNEVHLIREAPLNGAIKNVYKAAYFGASFTKEYEIDYTPDFINVTFEFDTKGNVYFFPGHGSNYVLSTNDGVQFDTLKISAGNSLRAIDVDISNDKLYMELANTNKEIYFQCVDNISGANPKTSSAFSGSDYDEFYSRVLFVNRGVIYFYKGALSSGSASRLESIDSQTVLDLKMTQFTWASFSN